MPDPTPVLPMTLAPFRIGPDWLTLSMTGPPSIFNFDRPKEWIGGRVWIDSGKRTSVMGKLFYLMTTGGEKLMTVAGQPNKGMGRAPDWMLVQFANVTLHTGEFIELYDTLRQMGFRYLAVTRLDIAADGLEDAGGNFTAPLNWENDGSAQYYGKLHWQPRKEGRHTVKGAALGSPASNKWFRVYDKTRELKTAAARHKAAHIRAAWTDALGFDPMDEGRTVQRFEFRTKGREIRRYFKEESTTDQDAAADFIGRLNDPTYLSSVFASMAAKCYDFRTPAERARDAVPLVAWDFGAVVGTAPLRIEQREPRKMAITDTALKQTAKGLWRIAYTTADEQWMDKAEQIARTNGLGAWFRKSVPHWERELRGIMAIAMQTGETERLDALYKLRGNSFADDNDTPS